MSKSIKKSFSFENDLNFENLSSLLNDLGIASHPLTNEQKVCIEYPNISSESKNFDIFGETQKKTEGENEADKESKSANSEFTLNISKNKTYTINVEKLYNKIKKNCSYNLENFTYSLKIFVSIFNIFNEDIFKWNLEDYDLFTSSNKIQFLTIENSKSDFNMNQQLELLYKEHLDEENKNILHKIKNDNTNNNESAQNDDFVDDFEENRLSSKIVNNDDDSFGNNVMVIGDSRNENKDEIIFRNIYFLVNLFNLMNKFCLNDFNIDNLMRNISLFNSYIINDPKILLFIHFNLCIQINLTLSKQTIDNFLGISSVKNTPTSTSISSTVGPIIGKTINFFAGSNDKSSINGKIGNTGYIPSICFIDFYFLEHKDSNNDEKELNKEKIILFNFILKSFIWTFFVRNKINLKIYIKIFNILYFSSIKNEIIINQNINKNDKLFELAKNLNYANLLSDNNTKEYISLINTDFKFVDEIKVTKIEEFFKIYFPIFLNCNMISFDLINKAEKVSLNDFIEELNLIIWLFKFYLKLRKYKFKKYTFTFSSNSFSLAIKKNQISKIEESYTKEITLFMGISHYKPIELIKHLSDINNFNEMYKLYKSIIQSCYDYQNYDIGVRLFKDSINNKELRYYIAMLILKLENYIHSHKEVYKKLVLYENKLINRANCVYLNIKKKILKMKNKQNNISNNNLKGDNSDLNVSFKLREKNEGGVLSKIDIFTKLKKNTKDSNADKNNININNFYKSLGMLGLNHEEKMAIYNFIKEVKYYFTEFIVFSSKSIILNDKDESFDPINILHHFTNNKCFMIITDMSFIDIYIYLTDSFDINFLSKEEGLNTSMNNDNSSLFFNAIISSLKVLKFVCKENFDNNHGHIQLRKTNIILSKNTFFKNELFQDYKSLFIDNNNIFVLDKSKKTNCIFGDTHISLINDIDEAEDETNDHLYEDYFMAFYSIFMNEYDIIKFVNGKKLRKYNKLDVIYNKKILQIKDGKIQIKKISYDDNKTINKDSKTKEIKDEEKKEEKKVENKKEFKEENNTNIIINNKESERSEDSIDKKEMAINENENNNNNELIESKDKLKQKAKKLKCIKHNIFKIKELFEYQNSYPIISFMLLKETDISNLSFLLYVFEEIFLSKKNENETKDTISRKIQKFFVKCKLSKFTPIIFNEKYFYKFIQFFNRIIYRKYSNPSISNKEEIKTQLFENVVFINLDCSNGDKIVEGIKNKINEEKNILVNLLKKIHIFNIKINENNKYSKNQIGKLFKYKRIFNTMKEFNTKAASINKDNENILIYEISLEVLDEIIKKNKKKLILSEEKKSINEKELKIEDINECIII